MARACARVPRAGVDRKHSDAVIGRQPGDVDPNTAALERQPVKQTYLDLTDAQAGRRTLAYGGSDRDG
ncbi:MAG: hypothetical protein ABWZ43_08645, partial [Solirubrobacterales bacterium]